MSIQITVRLSNGTTQNQTINGDGEIDTKTEAEDALAFAPNDGDSVDVNGRTYTRQQLIDIRDTKTPAAEGDATPKLDVDQLILLNGEGGKGVGKWAHNSGGFEMAYAHRLWSKDSSPVSLWGKAGGAVNVNDWNFETPGGEAANSHFTRYGVTTGLGLDVNPKGGKVHIGVGLNGSVSGFSSTESTFIPVSNCVEGETGQQECTEPGAGPIQADTGTTGVYNPDAHNSQGDNGLAVTGGLNLSLGVELPTKSETGVRLFAYAEPRATYVSDRHPFGFLGIVFGGGAAVAFGKPAPAPTPSASNPVSDGNPVDNTATPLTANTVFDPSPFIAALPANATVTRMELTDGKGAVEATVTKAPWVLPADKMKDGDHTLRIYYTVPGQTGEKYREIRIKVGGAAPIQVPAGDTGAAYGFVLDMPATASRPAPDVVGGVSTPRPIPLGNIQTSPSFPAGAKYQLFVDGNPVGTPADLPTDRRTDLALPATVGDGPHQVELRVQRPGQPEVRFPARAVNVGPSSKFDAANPVSMSQPTYNNAKGSKDVPYVVIRTTGAVAGGVTVTVNGNPISNFPGSLIQGENRVQLSVPAMKMTNNTAGVKAGTYTVTVTIGGESKTTNLVIAGATAKKSTKPTTPSVPQLH